MADGKPRDGAGAVPVTRRHRKDRKRDGRGPKRGKTQGGRGRVSPARVAAARALIEVDRGAHVEDVLGKANLDGRERAHAWFLALGTLRHRASVDAALRPLLRQPLGGLDAEVRAVLRLGCFEKIHGRAGDHAVVNESVEVIKGIGAARASGLVNAVLRRVRPVDLGDDEALEHPSWLLARWRERYGAEATEAWAWANNVPAPLSIVAREGADLLAARLVEAGLTAEPVSVAGRLLSGVLRVGELEGSVTQLPGFDEGAFWVQDPAAVAVADLALEGLAEGARVLDACAAPGGKTARLLVGGADVTAVDAKGARLQRMREGLQRLTLTATLRHHDWTEGPLPDAGEPFDVVLVDAPCTGLGTVRRHPEIRWRRQLVDLFQMAELQARVLAGAAQHVRPGGRLVYAVCSPEPEEGVEVIQAFLASHPDFSRVHELSTAPPQDHEDAHYAAVLQRADAG